MGEPVAGSAVDEIKERLEIADVVAAYVPLKQSGRSMKGLCPFHGEKTPSFYVFPETGTWKCFGCGEGGDVFTFVQKQENIDFVDALRLLAARSGVELPSRDQRAPEDRALEDRLRDTLLVAERYFQAALKGLVGASARAYLDRRGITDAGVERFSLGYAPASGLLRHLLEHGHTADEAAEVGLAGSREDGSRFEMFRERLMFPIRDPSGRTIAFGGRTLGDGQPKYLNGPQTRFFDKSGCLFALDLARPAIRKCGQAVIVEGYLDALIAHQYGYDNVVATLGTALTGRHLELLGKADQIVLALDADAAGQAATLRGLQVVQDAPGDTVVPVPVPGVRGLLRYQAVRKSEVRVLTLPAGLDPDDLIRKDPTEWGRLVGAATPVVDFVLNRLGERFDLASPRGKQDAVQEAMSIFRDLTDPIVREHYLQRLAAIVGVDESGLRAAIRQLRPRSLAQRAEAQVAQSRPFPEAYAIALHLLLPAADSSLVANDCSSAEARAVLAMVDDLPIEQRTAESLQSLVESAEPSLRPSLSRVLDWLSAVEKLSPEQRARELEVAVLKLRQQLLKLQHQQVLVLLAEPDAQGSPSTPVSMLTSIAAQLREIESALAARDGVGSLVWRSRQLGEVFGG